MTEMVENPAGGLPLPQKKISKTKIYVILAVLLAVLLFSGVFTLWYAFCVDQTLYMRLMSTAVAAFFLFLPVRFVWLSIRRKWKNGQWSPTEQERKEMQFKWANQGTAAWLRFVPSWLKNESTDPRGLKLILALFCTTLTAFAGIWLFREHVDVWKLPGLIPMLLITAYSIWDLYRKPKRTLSSAEPSNHTSN